MAVLLDGDGTGTAHTAGTVVFDRPHIIAPPSDRIPLSPMSFDKWFDDPARPARPMPTRLAALACAALILAGCGKQSDDGAKKKDAAAQGPIPVTVRQLQPQRVPITFEAVGQAEGAREVEIRARVSGILEKRQYAEGAAVKAGAVLFVIDRAPYALAVAQAKAALSQERAKLDLAVREAERLKMLTSARAISQREYDEAQSTVRQTTASIEGAQAKLSEAELNLSYTTVRAPISGVTGRALRSEGSLITANTDTALLTTLTQVDPIWVRFSLAETDYERLRGNERGARVKIVKEDGSIAADNGRLNFSGSTVDPKIGTVQLRAEFPNRNNAWLPGQFMKVNIVAGEQQAFLVPQAAVVQTEQSRSVWVVGDEGKVAMRPVQTAGWYENDWIVTGGLKPGEAIVVDNLMKMRPGVAVQPQTGTPRQADAGAAPIAAAPDKKAPAASVR
jgi:membrane fusion protein, multidrug efflux system